MSDRSINIAAIEQAINEKLGPPKGTLQALSRKWAIASITKHFSDNEIEEAANRCINVIRQTPTRRN